MGGAWAGGTTARGCSSSPLVCLLSSHSHAPQLSAPLPAPGTSRGKQQQGRNESPPPTCCLRRATQLTSGMGQPQAQSKPPVSPRRQEARGVRASRHASRDDGRVVRLPRNRGSGIQARPPPRGLAAKRPGSRVGPRAGAAPAPDVAGSASRSVPARRRPRRGPRGSPQGSAGSPSCSGSARRRPRRPPPGTRAAPALALGSAPRRAGVPAEGGRGGRAPGGRLLCCGDSSRAAALPPGQVSWPPPPIARCPEGPAVRPPPQQRDPAPEPRQAAPPALASPVT